MDNLSQVPQTMTFGKAGLAVGLTTTLSQVNQVDYMIKGKSARKAATTNEATPTTDAQTGSAFTAIGVNKGGAFVLCRNAAGDLKVLQGGIEDLDSTATFIKAPQFPSVPDTLCPIGYLITKVGATGAAWTFGSSNLAGPPTGVTHTLVDLGMLPDRPQVA